MNSNNKFKILIVEDEASIRSYINTNLEKSNYQPIQAKNGEEGKMFFASYTPDLVILDLGLPDIDGMDFIKHVRKTSGTPIVVLSARANEEDKVSALDLGANDYVTKPFGTAELMARVRATLRGLHCAETDICFCAGDMKIDYANRVVTVSGEKVMLSQTEYNILAFLSKNAEKLMPYTSIVRAVWGNIDHGSIKKLQVNMAHIRKKLGIRPGNKQYIANELGIGYRMMKTEPI